jgi:FkbM family methyltransferase
MSISVLLSTAHKKWPYQRQTPAESMAWGESIFAFNKPNKKSDALVVYDEPHTQFKTRIPKDRRILFISEPPSIKKYNSEYLEQFGIIVTPQHIDGVTKDTKQIISQLSLPWHYGVAHSHRFKNYETYESLKALQPPNKQNKISTIISSKTMNEHHLQRIETTRYLKENLGDEFFLYGRGYNEIDDKAEGILPFAFHLVCENNNIDHFWTEKLADAYLGWSFPIFSGCKNISDYFPQNSFIQVDLNKPEETLQTLKTLLDTPDFYTKHLPAIKEARNLILDQYNLFAVIDKIISDTEFNMKNTLSLPKFIQPQTTRKNMPQKIFVLFKKVINKCMPIVLPLYFKAINFNPDFLTDYQDQIGKKKSHDGYYGQRGQDWFLDQKIFKGKKIGFFLDVGANDPITLNNTYHFEQKGWNGLAFEPQERFRNKWKERRTTECLPDLLGANDGEEVTFVEYDTDEWHNALSGVEGYLLEKGANIDNLPKKRTTLIKRKLSSILNEKNIQHIDFMSLDVEGFEMEVLQGIDFENVHIEAMIIENDRNHLGSTELRKFVKGKGYKHIARLSGDDIFVKAKTQK